MLCNHEAFHATVNVARLADDNQPLRFQADITIACLTCGEPFAFLGLPAGVHFHGAAVSTDGTEARLAIVPVLEYTAGTKARYFL